MQVNEAQFRNNRADMFGSVFSLQYVNDLIFIKNDFYGNFGGISGTICAINVNGNVYLNQSHFFNNNVKF